MVQWHHRRRGSTGSTRRRGRWRRKSLGFDSFKFVNRRCVFVLEGKGESSDLYSIWSFLYTFLHHLMHLHAHFLSYFSKLLCDIFPNSLYYSSLSLSYLINYTRENVSFSSPISVDLTIHPLSEPNILAC